VQPEVAVHLENGRAHLVGDLEAFRKSPFAGHEILHAQDYPLKASLSLKDDD
jgi:hypothetical protein